MRTFTSQMERAWGLGELHLSEKFAVFGTFLGNRSRVELIASKEI